MTSDTFSLHPELQGIQFWPIFETIEPRFHIILIFLEICGLRPKLGENVHTYENFPCCEHHPSTAKAAYIHNSSKVKSLEGVQMKFQCQKNS